MVPYQQKFLKQIIILWTWLKTVQVVNEGLIEVEIIWYEGEMC